MIKPTYFKEDYDYLKVESEDLDGYIDFINKNDIKNIIINSVFNFRIKNIDFIVRCPLIERLFIVDNDLNIDAISELKNLKSIVTSSSPKIPIDLSKFKMLEELRIDYNKKWKNLKDCESIKILRLDKYKEEGLELIEGLINLEKLSIVGGSLVSLSTSANFKKLKFFSGYSLKKLIHIDFQEELNSLEEIIFENCKNIKNHEKVVVLKNLKKVMFKNCGKIKTLNFIDEMSNLEEFKFPFTDVEDGDMNILDKIDVFYFTNKKHFSAKYEEMMIKRN